MSLPLQYSDYNNEAPKNIRKNKTYKKRPTKKVQNFLQSMDNNNMADFKALLLNIRPILKNRHL